MNKKLIALVTVASLLVVGLLAGCSVKGGASLGDVGNVEYSGKTITITLASNPTTGYEWSCVLNGSSIKQTGENYSNKAPANTNVAGASGTQTYTFEGVGQGESTITLTYARSGEKSDYDITSTITVTTDSSGNAKKLSAQTEDAESSSYSTSSVS